MKTCPILILAGSLVHLGGLHFHDPLTATIGLVMIGLGILFYLSFED